MRRFSQRSSLVTLSEINITPLLDLAFVLLIIFIITTPLLQQTIPLTLPKGGQADKPGKVSIRLIEITPSGVYYYDGKATNLAYIETALVRDYQANTNLAVDVRADGNTRAREIYALMDICVRNGIRQWRLRTEPDGRR